MKFLVIVAGLVALGICGQAVKPDDSPYFDQIKQKARQIHKKLDLNKDGEVSFNELTEGIKRGIGLSNGDQDKNQIKKYFESFMKNKKDKKEFLTEEDIQKFLKEKSQQFKSKANKAAKEAGDVITEKMTKAKEKITDTYQDIKDTASQKFQKMKDTASQKLEEKFQEMKEAASQRLQQVKVTASQRLQQMKGSAQKIRAQASDRISEFFEESMENLKQKANEIYDKYDKNKNGTFSLENLKEAIKSGIGYEYFKKQDQKDFTSRINNLYEKYVKSNQKNKPISKDDFFKIYAEEHKVWRDKSMLEKSKQKASQLYDSFDLNKDGHVSLQQLGAGIKAGLGIGKSMRQLQDEGSIKKYTSDLYEKYVKGNQKNRKWFTVEDFSEILKGANSQKLDCDRIGKLTLEQLKVKAKIIHQQLDKNKDGQVTMDETTKKNQDQSNGVFQYVRELYEKYIGPGKQKTRFSEDDFNKIIEKWKEECVYNRNQKPKALEL